MSLYTGEGLPGVEDGESRVVLGLPTVVSGMLSACVLIFSRILTLENVPKFHLLQDCVQFTTNFTKASMSRDPASHTGETLDSREETS